MENKYVSEVMTKKVISVKANENLSDAFELLRENGFRHLPVVDGEGQIVGIISDRDLLGAFVQDDLRVAAAEPGTFLSDYGVSEIMTADPETIDETTPLSEACQVFIENKFDSLPVVNGQTLIGILTATDILKEMIRREEPEDS